MKIVVKNFIAMPDIRQVTPQIRSNQCERTEMGPMIFYHGLEVRWCICLVETTVCMMYIWLDLFLLSQTSR